MSKKLTNQQMEEAIRRMKKLELHDNVINDFIQGKLNKSVPTRLNDIMVGTLIWLQEEEELMCRELENQYDIVVYHVVESFTSFGHLFNMFYVSKHIEEWEYDEESFDYNQQFVYVKNLDDDLCSEFGSIQYKKAYGGLIRTA